MKLNTNKMLGKRIMAERKKRKWSRAKFAQECGWGDTRDPQKGVSRVAYYENGEREPKLDHVARMAEAFGMTQIELHYGPATEKRIPIFNIDELSPYVEYLPEIPYEKCKEWINYIHPMGQTSDNIFAAKLNTNAYSPELTKGEILIVDPLSTPEHDSLVIYQSCDSGKLLIRSYCEDGDQVFLKAVGSSPVDSTTPDDRLKFVGEVVSSLNYV